MKQKKCLNPQRLTKQQVQELIANEGKLHLEFSNCFAQTYATGYRNQPLIYELSEDRFLFVFDPKARGLGGKGDIYPREYFLRWVRSTQRLQQDLAKGCYSSTTHWHYYSQHRENLIHRIDFLIRDLAEQLAIAPRQLDFSYPSLDIITQQAENYGCLANSPAVDHDPQAHLINHLYDNLVAYIGEVLRHRIQGEWAISNQSIDENSSYNYPYVQGRSNSILMPINIVWQELSRVPPMNWRQETTNEIRRSSLKIMG